jgi:hypothetical protein
MPKEQPQKNKLLFLRLSAKNSHEAKPQNFFYSFSIQYIVRTIYQSAINHGISASALIRNQETAAASGFFFSPGAIPKSETHCEPALFGPIITHKHRSALAACLWCVLPARSTKWQSVSHTAIKAARHDQFVIFDATSPTAGSRTHLPCVCVRMRFCLIRLRLHFTRVIAHV